MSSHGSSSSDRCEPNLIPLLDMVLQLVMFFMVCANFVMEELNAALQLPQSTQSQVLDQKVPNSLFLEVTVDQDGNDRFSMREDRGSGSKRTDLNDPLDAKLKLEDRYTEDLNLNNGDKSKPLRTKLILLADKRASYGGVHAILKAAKDAGYTEILIRTKMKDTIQ